jgi:hypothetical protein
MEFVFLFYDYGLESRGIRVRVPVGAICTSSRSHPDRYCGPTGLLCSGYKGHNFWNAETSTKPVGVMLDRRTSAAPL